MASDCYVTFGNKDHPTVKRFKKVAKENGIKQYHAVFEALKKWCDEKEQSIEGKKHEHGN